MISVSEAITQLFSRNRSVYFDPLGGNNGDRLIEMGARKCIELYGGAITNDKTHADAIIINGGGAMTPAWGGFEILRRHLESGAKEILVLPSSYWPQKALEEITTVQKRLRKRLTMFARDRESYERLHSALGTLSTISLGHDMALSLTESDILHCIGGVAPSRGTYVLIVERRDAEASTHVAAQRPFPLPFKSLVPQQMRRPLKRLLLRGEAETTSFALACKQIARSQGYKTENAIASDVSDTTQFSFEQFVCLVGRADMVFTTRLHVAVLRHILKRPCLLHPTGGDYRKNEVVFDYSMRDSGYVKRPSSWGC